MAQPPKRPTQVDVADLAGVSRGTVSLVLNKQDGRVPISEGTRRRVLAAARELGYAPNPVAQMLASGRNRIVGFFTFEETFRYAQEDFHHPYLFGIERRACERDFDLLLFTRGGTGRDRAIYRGGMNSLRLADGTVFIGTDPDPEGLERLLGENYPFVLIGRTRIANDRIDTVVHDHTRAAIDATTHLLDGSHRRLAFAADALDTEFIRDRLAGTETAVGRMRDATLVVLCGPVVDSAASLERALRQHGATALICADRRMLPAVRGMAAEGRVRVPDDLSVVFLVTDDDEFFMTASRVRLDRAMLGRIAFDRLIERVEGRAEGFRRILVPCDFVVGRTTRPLARD